MVSLDFDFSSIIMLVVIISAALSASTASKKAKQKGKSQNPNSQRFKPDIDSIDIKDEGVLFGPASFKPLISHDESKHTHDRLSENIIRSESQDEHYRHQINSFLKAGLIDKKEAAVLWENYMKSRQ